MSNVQIGSKYQGPCYDKPCLRQMPHHWVLEESRINYRPAWYRRVEVWTAVIVVFWLLVGAARI
ncbi:MAG: hypothetical protein NUV75_02090 [Gallionella sp.]|nr:hypothetical protein [Gallionella sp.]